MDIRTAMDELVRLESELSISEPSPKSIAKAYKYGPPQSIGSGVNLPCWYNDFTLTSYDLGIDMGMHIYTAHAQLFVGRGYQDVHADIAAAFLTQFLKDLTANSSLKTKAGVSTVTNTAVVGGNPTLVGFARANDVFIGLDLFVTMRIEQAETIG